MEMSSKTYGRPKNLPLSANHTFAAANDLGFRAGLALVLLTHLDHQLVPEPELGVVDGKLQGKKGWIMRGN